MANVKTNTFGDFATAICSLIGIPYASLPASQQTAVQSFYQSNAEELWFEGNFLDICPYGEARFVGNSGQYPNDLSQTTYWTNTALTITANSLANPADGKVSASKLLETSATSAHNALQSFTYIPLGQYQVTTFARPIGGRYLYLSANDGVTTYSAFFNVATGVIGTQANLATPATMNQASNGFYFCTITFNANAAAGAGNYGVGVSSDGSTLSYAGNTADGLYSWGTVLTQTSYAAPTALLMNNDTLGEDFLDTVYQIWRQSPIGIGYPQPQSYIPVQGGYQVIGSTGWNWNGYFWTFPAWYIAGNPLFVYYRKGIPLYSGTAYSGASTYAVNDQILFTNAKGVMDFWKCTTATTAGQSPDTTPASWTELTMPNFMFWYVVYGALADFLRSDGQYEKAALMDTMADDLILRIHDTEERQQGKVLPFRVNTHQTQSSTRFY